MARPLKKVPRAVLKGISTNSRVHRPSAAGASRRISEGFGATVVAKLENFNPL